MRNLLRDYFSKPNLPHFSHSIFCKNVARLAVARGWHTWIRSLATAKQATFLQNILSENCSKLDFKQYSFKNLSKYWYFSKNTWKCISIATSYHKESNILWLIYDLNIAPLPLFAFPQCLPPLFQVKTRSTVQKIEKVNSIEWLDWRFDKELIKNNKIRTEFWNRKMFEKIRKVPFRTSTSGHQSRPPLCNHIHP